MFSDGVRLFSKAPVGVGDELLSRVSAYYQSLVIASKQSAIKEPIKTRSKQVKLAKASVEKQSVTVDFDTFIRAKVKDTAPIAILGVSKGKPNLITFVSKDCGHCKRMMEDVNKHPERFDKVNLIFIPVGGGTNEEWAEFFGYEGIKFKQGELEVNSQFYSDAHKKAGVKAGTPSNLWISKHNGDKYSLIVGRIPSSKMDAVYEDMTADND